MLQEVYDQMETDENVYDDASERNGEDGDKHYFPIPPFECDVCLFCYILHIKFHLKILLNLIGFRNGSRNILTFNCINDPVILVCKIMLHVDRSRLSMDQRKQYISCDPAM